MTRQLALTVLISIALAGCVGSAGIGADGAATAGPETSVYRYTKTLPDGSTATAEAVIAKKAQVQGLRFTTSRDGTVSMEIDTAESGDRHGQPSLRTGVRVLAVNGLDPGHNLVTQLQLGTDQIGVELLHRGRSDDGAGHELA